MTDSTPATAAIWPNNRQPAGSIERTAAVWAARQCATEAKVRGDLDERTVVALVEFLLRIGVIGGMVYVER